MSNDSEKLREAEFKAELQKIVVNNPSLNDLTDEQVEGLTEFYSAILETSGDAITSLQAQVEEQKATIAELLRQKRGMEDHILKLSKPAILPENDRTA